MVPTVQLDMQNTIIGLPTPVLDDRARKSTGHLTFAFDGAIEFYEQDGQVYRATVYNGTFGPDGRRYGRWECSIGHYHRYKNVLTGGL